MTSRFNAVVFDLGGVLVDWNPRYLFRRLFHGDDAAMEAFLRDVCSPEWNEMQDAGRPIIEATRELIERHPAHEDMIRAYYGQWPEMLGGAIDGTVGILRELRARPVRLLALTNWSAETFPVALERFDFLGWFEGVVVSGRERMKKPDPRIFRLLIERHGLEPGASVYIDDVEKNVRAARDLGLHAVLFLSPEQLRSDLAALGVL